MKIEEYNKYGKVGRFKQFVLCEDFLVDNSPRLNKANIAYAVNSFDSCDEEGFYPCCCLYFSELDITSDYYHTGCFGKSVKFNPQTEEFKFSPPEDEKDNLRFIDFLFYYKAASASLDELKEMVEQGANPSAEIYNSAGYFFYAIHQAAINKDINVIKYLVSLGVNPCLNDFWRTQPLSYAVKDNSLEMIQYLVEEGNDPCNTDDEGHSVLSEAALNPDIRVIEYLLECGAKVDCCAIGVRELERALTEGTIERMKFFIDLGADLNSAMDECCYYAPLANIRYALECGYNPNRWILGSFADGHREKVIDSLTPKRKALFIEYGGVVHYKDAEICGEEVRD